MKGPPSYHIFPLAHFLFGVDDFKMRFFFDFITQKKKAFSTQ